MYKTTLDPKNFTSIVARFIEIAKDLEMQAPEFGEVWTIEISRWALEQAIINRDSNKSMMEAAEDWIDSLQARVSASQ